ncbi:FG-GAP repeat domain-containing protein [Streptomyces sp. NPDC093795]|uniref:FG-GAP repeat domain-containing protein n=1 Tax=Streptomyces sp. NPDC093795 TaxID=3366051 RepID=UPI0038301B89
MTSRTARRRLSTAITAVLAVTAGTALAAAPSAGAAPAVTPAAVAAPAGTADEQDTYAMQFDRKVTSAGPGGYLTGTPHRMESIYSFDYHWHRPDGTSTLVTKAWARERAEPNAAVSDIVPIVNGNADVIRLRDMSAPAGTAPVVFDLTTLNTSSLTYRYVTTIGSTLLVEGEPTSGPSEFRLLTEPGDPGRKITGLPAGIEHIAGARATADTVFLRYNLASPSGDNPGNVTVDLATATAGAAHPTPQLGYWSHPLAINDTHLAWWQDDTTLVIADRAGGAPKPITFPRAEIPIVGLLKGWVVHGTSTLTGGGTAGDPTLPLTARPIAGGDPVKLLDRTSNLTAGPDGSLLAYGGTAEHGEGFYRVALGTDGKPTATLLSSTGQDTVLTLKKTGFGPVVDLDTQDGSAYLSWELSHGNYEVSVSLVHKRTGQRFNHRGNEASRYLRFLWNGKFDSHEGPGQNAYNGDYRWELVAEPTNGIGEPVRESGDFTVVRVPKAHDFNDNGSPDLFARVSSGDLWRFDTVYDAQNKKVVPITRWSGVGSGWNYPQMEAVGNVAGTSAPDVIGVDSAGLLWLHPGTGVESKPFGTRVRVGGGWQIYNKLTGGSDLTGDGRTDLVATDKSGDLWLYKATGSLTSPYAPRKRIGVGWGIYNQLTATGNLAGGPAGDLVARDKDGVLWLYLGVGDGTLGGRVKIGPGWNQYTQFAGVGDATGDGLVDLYVYGPNNTSYVYNGTGHWRAPFATRVPTDALINTGSTYTHVL